ncbi:MULTISPECIES: thioredoxin [Kitasatospora]|uniref:NifU family protein n=1 Tax=Kitasatospora cystarginea TaxID=58350 RepID=A0ABP5R5D8_9ACTN
MSAELTGLRVKEVLDSLTASGQAEAGEVLVRELMAFYSAGLARLVELLPPGVLTPLLDDRLVAGLLALHDLHPEDVTARIARAVADFAVEVVGFDRDSGVLALRKVSGCGCGSSAMEDVESALSCHAPEVTAVELERPPAPLLQIGARPPAAAEVR